MGANKSTNMLPAVDSGDIRILAEKTGKSAAEIEALISEIFQLNPNGRLNMIEFTYYYKKLYFSLVTPIFKAPGAGPPEVLSTQVSSTSPSSELIESQNVQSSSHQSTKEQNGMVMRRNTSDLHRRSSLGLARRSINFVTMQLNGGPDPIEHELQLRMEHSWEFAALEPDQLIKTHLFAQKCFKSFDLEQRGYLFFEDLFMAFVLTTKDELVKKLKFTFR